MTTDTLSGDIVVVNATRTPRGITVEYIPTSEGATRQEYEITEADPQFSTVAAYLEDYFQMKQKTHRRVAAALKNVLNKGDN